MTIQKIHDKSAGFHRNAAWSELDDPRVGPVSIRAYAITITVTGSAVFTLWNLYLLVMP